jgi:hypothetical protein
MFPVHPRFLDLTRQFESTFPGCRILARNAGSNRLRAANLRQVPLSMARAHELLLWQQARPQGDSSLNACEFLEKTNHRPWLDRYSPKSDFELQDASRRITTW